ncbi:M28 family peptidase [Maribacter sp. 2307ULW6-5]|uniref:M28 family peptidase n=1 Tax=Maribacter sp. 2307ULW6-5 TaxID=3386275 RepID=UPI0039BD3A93
MLEYPGIWPRVLKGVFLGLLLVNSTWGTSQQPMAQASSGDYLDLVREGFTGDLAHKTTAYAAQFWRVAGNTGFNKTIFHIVEQLERAGYVPQESATAADRLTYVVARRPMEHPTWEPVSANVRIVGQSQALLDFESNWNMIYLHSPGTPEMGVEAEIVRLDTTKEVSQQGVAGKIVYINGRLRPHLNQLLRAGALGAMTYDNPSYLQPEKNNTSIQFRRLPPKGMGEFWALALSHAAKGRLEAALEQGSVRAKVNIATKRYDSEELTVVAHIKGSRLPNERLVLSAHVQEPGANDNASGVGAQLEMAALAARLLREKKVDLARTLTFLWGDEIISTRRYIQEDPERAKGIKWGVSLDMVGQNTALTWGSFLLEKMPDPSAIWTRGEDKHTEWGGRTLSLQEMKPHYLNDFLTYIFKEQGNHAHWEVNTNPFEGGSDHTPFLDADIPGVLLWHFTDQFYHTDNDTMDKVSQETLANVGTAALASALRLVNSDAATAMALLPQLEATAKERLEAELQLSLKAMASGENPKGEAVILRAWQDWYAKAFASVRDMERRPSTALRQEIAAAQERLARHTNALLAQLSP